jgi:hypothetical protein
MSLNSDTLSWLWANQSLVLLLIAACFSKETTNTSSIVFWSQIKFYRTRGEHTNHYYTLMFYHTRGEHTNHYTLMFYHTRGEHTNHYYTLMFYRTRGEHTNHYYTLMFYRTRGEHTNHYTLMQQKQRYGYNKLLLLVTNTLLQVIVDI